MTHQMNCLGEPTSQARALTLTHSSQTQVLCIKAPLLSTYKHTSSGGLMS